jgi:hypothetical protein
MLALCRVDDMLESMLTSCTGCRRHVKVATGVCPFCRSTVADAQELRQVRAGSSRAMRVFASAALAVAASASTIACYGGAPIPLEDERIDASDASVDSNVPRRD